MKNGRKPEKLSLAWAILVREAKKNTLPGSNSDVWEPLARLAAQGPMSYGTAVRCLTNLEGRGYLTKHTNGTPRLLFVHLLKLGELGEDILGKQEEKPQQEPRRHEPQVPKSDERQIAEAPQEPPETVSPVATKIASAQNNAANGVVVLCDHENLRYTLQDAGVVLDYSSLIAGARKYGNVLRSVAFVPMHTSPDIQTQLRIGGFKIETCPPRKTLGPDTCDSSIEDFVRFCLDNPKISTFVLVSGDGDFIDIVDEIKNNGRKCVLFYYNHADTSKALFARATDAFNLASLVNAPKRGHNSVSSARIPPEKSPEATAPKVATEIHQAVKPVDENKYTKALLNLQNGTTILDQTDIHSSFLEAIVHCLKDRSYPKDRNAFPELKQIVWNELPMRHRRALTRDGDCHDALQALLKMNIIVSAQQDKEPHTYYFLDRKHPLVAVLTPQAAT